MHLRQWHVEDKHSVFCGLDLGTSGLKGVLINDSGEVVARGQWTYVTERPVLGASEQNPADWLAAIAQVVAQLDSAIPAEQWGAIGLSAMIPTLVCLDANANPVGSAITWEDSRAEVFGDQLRNAYGESKLYQRTGQWVDGRYLLPMWMRLAEIDPAKAKVTKTITGAKDYIFNVLTGQLCTDPSTATGFGCYDLRTGAWLSDVLRLASSNLELPRIADSTTSYPLTQVAATQFNLPAGIPIALGAADSVLGALGMGAVEVGDIAYVAGTSTVILGVASEIPVDPAHRFLVTPMAYPGTWGVEMDLLATGSAIKWLSGLLGFANEKAAVSAAAEINPEQAPVFLPYLSPGEQGALWNPDLTGVISGLHVGNTSAEVMRGLINGILLESKRCVDVLREYGCNKNRLLVAGGSALDPWFRQQLANVSKCEVIAPVDGDSDYSAMGAALVAGQLKMSQTHNTVSTKPDGNSTWTQLANQSDQIRVQIFNR
jgi:xylulokinase